MGKATRSPIYWTGGKARVVHRLLPLLPAHNGFCELFGGSAALLFSKDPCPVEIYNDLDSGLVGFFRVLRDPGGFGFFQYKAALSLYSREEYEFCRRTWRDAECEVERAFRWWVVARQSFGGRFGWGWRTMKSASSTALSRHLSAVDKLPEFHQRLRGVQVEHQDFRKVLRRYDSPEMLWYVDPPYVTETRSRAQLYGHELTDVDHQELVEGLLRLKGSVLVSGYSHPLYYTLDAAGWRRIELETRCPTASDTRTEVLWMNFEVWDTGQE